jgi:hypothetical protein
MFKLCIDCKHFKSKDRDVSMGKCTKDIKYHDYITGGEPEYFLAAVTRQHGCGHKAKWFEPKELAPPVKDSSVKMTIDHDPNEFKMKEPKGFRGFLSFFREMGA